ncbi:MAG: DUF4358 domain-containing protein [Oscillospiraceae bacterium]|nr:DUF4358 domain-containing protein [Oscillospiraceae bacterium]
MKFTKIIAMAAAISVCAAMLSACGGDTAEETVTSAETTASVSETAAESIETESETEAESESETEAESAEESAAEDETAEANPLMPLIDAIISQGEWPALMEVTDQQALTDFFLLDPSNENYTNMIVMQNPMSANMTEVIIIEASDVEAAKADLEARQKKAQEQDAFYPNDVERAGASIVGTEGNYAYFLLTNTPETVEENLIAAINAQ